jgi:hypothetical protein
LCGDADIGKLAVGTVGGLRKIQDFGGIFDETPLAKSGYTPLPSGTDTLMRLARRLANKSMQCVLRRGPLPNGPARFRCLLASLVARRKKMEGSAA